eukprot:12419868-Karenia_brevis.AAC.1
MYQQGSKGLRDEGSLNGPRAKRPRDQGTSGITCRGPGVQGTRSPKGPRDQGIKGPKERTKAPRDQGTNAI